MKPVRCAVYTRKSSEEGLEQSFNSLHAQREACEAYILSQKHEGWRLVPRIAQATQKDRVPPRYILYRSPHCRSAKLLVDTLVL
jgi:DNA invertase Pin-like site-specific DNA recombinase